MTLPFGELILYRGRRRPERLCTVQLRYIRVTTYQSLGQSVPQTLPKVTKHNNQEQEGVYL